MVLLSLFHACYYWLLILLLSTALLLVLTTNYFVRYDYKIIETAMSGRE